MQLSNLQLWTPDMLAALVLAIHLGIIAFNIFGMLAIPLGAWRGWNFVHAPRWRLVHLASLGVVALQALFGRACFLTLWQNALEASVVTPEPLIMHWMNTVVFWPLPMWVFGLIYVLAFSYVIALLRFVPLRWR